MSISKSKSVIRKSSKPKVVSRAGISPTTLIKNFGKLQELGRKPGIKRLTATKEKIKIHIPKNVFLTGAIGGFMPLWEYEVQSSNLKKVWYDPQHQVMQIEFLNGSIYQYYEVPLAEFLSLMYATSHGHYFWANIRKPGLPGSSQYEFARIK